MHHKTSFLKRFCHLSVSTEAPYVANDGWRRTNWVGRLGWWQRHFFTFLGAEKLWICNITWNQRSVREHLFLISRTPQLKARSMCCFQFDLILLLMVLGLFSFILTFYSDFVHCCSFGLLSWHHSEYSWPTWSGPKHLRIFWNIYCCLVSWYF